METVQAESFGSHLKSQAVPNLEQTAEKNWSEPNDNFSEAGGFADLRENSNARMPEQSSPLKNGFSNTKRNFTPFTVKTKKGLAICSLVFGIIGMPPVSFLFGALLSVILGLIFGTAGFVAGLVLAFLFSPAALISGITALLRANKKPHLFGGKGLAIAGIVCGAVGFLIFPIIAAVAVPNVAGGSQSGKRSECDRYHKQSCRSGKTPAFKWRSLHRSAKTRYRRWRCF